MTNNYEIVDGPDGEPTVRNKSIKIRGYFTDKVTDMVNKKGWEYAASKVCGYCGGYIEDEDEDAEFTRHICCCSEEDRQPQNPVASI
jgi:hypothetical protein